MVQAGMDLIADATRTSKLLPDKDSAPARSPPSPALPVTWMFCATRMSASALLILNRAVLGYVRSPMVVGALIPRPDAWGRVSGTFANSLHSRTSGNRATVYRRTPVRSDIAGIEIGHVHARHCPSPLSGTEAGNLASAACLTAV